MKSLSRHPLARLVCLFGLVHGLVGADCCGLDVPRSPYSVTNDTAAVLNISCGNTTTMGVLPGESADCEGDKGPLFEVRITAAVGSQLYARPARRMELWDKQLFRWPRGRKQ